MEAPSNHGAVEPRSTITGRCRGLAKLTVSVLPGAAGRAGSCAGTTATAATTDPPRKMLDSASSSSRQKATMGDTHHAPTEASLSAAQRSRPAPKPATGKGRRFRESSNLLRDQRPDLGGVPPAVWLLERDRTLRALGTGDGLDRTYYCGAIMTSRLRRLIGEPVRRSEAFLVKVRRIRRLSSRILS